MAMVPGTQVKMKEAAALLKTRLRPESEEDQKVVQKGLMLYRQGMVHHLKYVGGSIWASVQDVTPVRVYLSFPDPEDSSCTCPAYGFCRHRMAAFFQAYAEIGSVADWVDEWRRPAKESLQAEEWGLQKAKELMKSASGHGKGYTLWTNNFTRSFNEIMLGQGKPNPYVIASLLQTYLRGVRAGAPSSPEWRTLYELIGRIYGFKQLAALSEELEHNGSTVNRYYRYLFDSLEDEIDDGIHSLSVNSMPFDFDEYIEALKDESAELIDTADLFEYERANLYRMLWSGLFKQNSWREEERERLEAFGDGKRTMAEDVALAHHYYLARRDRELFDFLKKLDGTPLSFLFYWLEDLGRQGENARLGAYIEYMAGQMRPTLASMQNHQQARDFTRLALRTAAPYFRHGGREELYEKLLNASLPYSYIEYEDYLFEKGSYEKWGELFTYTSFEHFTVPNDKVKVLQKEAPEVLLPLLHQAADGLILQKNRSAYKQAVRILKKLRAAYKKLKRTPEWEAYFDKLLEKNKRLRAFHAECVRGKLIVEKE
ncbi:SWIM zinc finger family protein [Bacillus sp. FJAT-27251]|uniref:SWIM zinc finger family protein n=1 Tax=Bacillus sp. FJAT-27251 TaxID=1684142 RepID=UPI0006A7D484|nr:SWIM zinc finger family protein [Bacillus sp. FJAT-27251]